MMLDALAKQLFSSNAVQFLSGKLFEYLWVVVVWHFRWLVVDPLSSWFKLLTSQEYRNRKSIGGKYYFYHPPLMPEIGKEIPQIGQKIRVTKINLKVGVRSVKFEQSDAKVHRQIGYRGTAAFEQEFLFIHAFGAMKRYSSNEKFIVLYRYEHPENASRKSLWRFLKAKEESSNTGTCGLMIGIAHNHNIYHVPVVLSRWPLTYEEAERILAIPLLMGTTIPAATQVRGILEGISVRTPDEFSDFDSPFT